MNKFMQWAALCVAFIAYAMPSFFVALVLIILFSDVWNVLPPLAPQAASVGGILADPRALVMPVLTGTIATLAVFSRYVRSAVLALLLEKPMHGYQIISEIEQRSGGSWKPSAGSVYPTLQLLADEGLISAEESNGRKTYSLTEAGRAEAEGSAEKAAPWESAGGGFRDHGPMGALPKAGIELAQAAAQVGRTGTPEQVKEAVTILEEARRRLYSILAQD